MSNPSVAFPIVCPDNHWRCRKCQRVEPEEHVFCGLCATERFENIRVKDDEGKDHDVVFSRRYKCAIVAFIKGCIVNQIELKNVNDYDDVGVQNFLKSLDKKGFFEFSKSRDDLIKGNEVGDEIFNDLGHWYNISIIVYGPNYTMRVGSECKTKSFKVEWTRVGNIGHWVYKN